MKDYLLYICKEIGFTAEQTAELAGVYDKIADDVFFGFIKKYDEDFEAPNLKEYEPDGVNRYQAHLVVYLCLTKRYKEYLAEKGRPSGEYEKQLIAIRNHADFCKKEHGVTGTFIASWYKKVFELCLYNLGRLQFETAKLKNEVPGFEPGCDILNVHIPRGESLLKEDCLKSFDMAAEKFGPVSGNGRLLFTCKSWLLYPLNRQLITYKSNILDFMDLFDILYSEDTNNAIYMLFGTFDLNALPEDTRLQRAYKAHLLNGGTMGHGFGVRIKEFQISRTVTEKA